MALGEIIRRQGSATGRTSLLGVLEERLGTQRKKPPLHPDNNWARASAVPSMCAREEVLCALHGVERDDNVDASLNITFLHGTSLHWGVQNRLLGPLGILYGTWKCANCAVVYGKQQSHAPSGWEIQMPKTCSSCSGTEFSYVEPEFSDPELKLTGHCDGFIRLPGMDGFGILEVKSIGERGAREIQNTPQIGHTIQTHVYMHFTGLKWGKILYWQKHESGLRSLVEHHVDRDEETILMVKQMLSSLWTGIETGSLPERICANNTCPRAKSCSIVDLCFKGA